MQIATNLANHLRKVLGTLPTQGIGFHVLVKEFIGLQLRAVAGKKEQPNLISVCFEPRLYVVAQSAVPSRHPQ
jgi:hypothetical protein